MYKNIIVSLFMFLLVTSCAGRQANPVMVHRYGDEQKSCKALEGELTFTEDEIRRLIPETEKTGKNVGLGIAGFFLIVPWFFMDLSKAEQIEVNALRQRYNHLLIIAGDKECGLDAEVIPDFEETAKKAKEEEKAKK
jgi:hypothetical protein